MVLMATTIRSCIRLLPLLAVLAVAASLIPMRKAMGARPDPLLVVIKGAASELRELPSSFDKKLNEINDRIGKVKDAYRFWDDHHDDIQERLQALTPGAGGNSPSSARGNTPSGPVGYIVDIGNQKFSVSGIDIDSPVTRTGMCVAGVGTCVAVLGLGRTGTLARRFGTFSYVLSDRYASAVRLGVGKAQQGQGGRPTRLITNLVHPDRYYVHITSVLVGDLPLQIPPGALDIRRDGTGGVYLSTTRPIGMVLQGEVYELLKAALQNWLGAADLDANSQWLCYYPGATKVPVLPAIKLVFANDAVMALQPGSSVWYPRKDGAHCLAVRRSLTGETVLGTMVQMGRLMTYKLAADGVSDAVTFSA